MSSILGLLAPWLDVPGRRSLLVADENLGPPVLAALPAGLSVITNRIDVARCATAAGLDAEFSDFVFAPFGIGTLDCVCYPLSKEKSVVHHVANQCFRALKVGGEMVLIGTKQTGIKTFAQTIGERFGTTGRVTKQGDLYSAAIMKASDRLAAPLDDQDYDRLRPIFTFGDRPVVSKPGLFGWNKRDPGSQLLVDYLTGFFRDFGGAPRTALDLGCGYGYLSLAAASHGIETVTATENCAAALMACRANFAGHGLSGEVIADDCGASIEQTFDCLLCNPPFHQGFARDYQLTDRFLANARRLLRPGGRALFVVNRFVPLETRAAARFRHIDRVADDGSFKLVQLA